MIAMTPWRRTLPTWIHPESDLYTLNPDYVAGVEKAGGLVMIIPQVRSDEEARHVLATFDGLVLSGGNDVDPAHYGHENTASFGTDTAADLSDLALANAAIATELPLLAICRGAQIVNVALGGTMEQHIWGRSDDHPHKDPKDRSVEACEATLAHRHPVILEEGCETARLFGATKISANSLHHQAIDEPGAGINIVGRSPDGTVEVIEHESAPMVGVQWHPERLGGEGHQVLFDWVVGQARS